ncbi:MAG: hypothetical protein M3198_17810 [Actinomycetota bacterium]|nr:hypothetical protein [Actinomycetota bacterium]
MKFDRSVVLSTIVDVIFPSALVFSLFLLFAGHNAPGGGFIGGLVAGAGLVLRYVDVGPAAVRGERTPAGLLLGAGLMVAALSGAAGWIAGGAFLENVQLSVDLPVIGTVKAGLALLFDVGVFLVVVGLVQTVLSVLGGEVKQ